MDDHLIDIVDENNEPTGEQLPRSVVHAGNIWHRSAIAFVYRKIGDKLEFLIHKRAKTKDLSPDKIDPRVGGHLKSGETYDDAIVTEIEEELGLKINLKQLIKDSLVKEVQRHEFLQYYLLEYAEALGEIKPDPEEIQWVKWVDLETIQAGVENNPEQWARTVKRALKLIENIT